MALLHSRVIGKGPILVLLHGFLCSSLIWDRIIPLFKKEYKLILVDLPGHGESKDVYVNSIKLMAELVFNTLGSLGIEKFSVLGHSMGGYVAMEMAHQKVSSIEKIILLNSTPYADTKEKKNNRNRAIKAVQDRHEIFVRQFIPALFSKENIVACKNEITCLQEEASKVNTEMIIKGLEAMRDREDYMNELAKHLMINLILGDDDPVVDANSLLALLSDVSNVNLKVINDSGHMSFYEQPEICSELIEGCLS